MPTTTNFGWTTPADTDYVKDGANAIRTLANGIDTSLVDLKGGTTGQILSKNSNTDLDYTWINNDQGDITNVSVTSPITGGGSSGSVTIGINDGTTAQKGAVQLTDSTSSTSTTTAATPNSVKSAYDLANGAIPKTLTTTTGDIIYASSANTPARLGIGSSGNVLTVSGGVPVWSAPAGGGKVLQVVTATKTDTFTTSTGSTWLDITDLSVSITPSSTSSKIWVIANIGAVDASDVTIMGLRLVRGSTAIGVGTVEGNRFATSAGFINAAANRSMNITLMNLDSPSTTSATTYKVQLQGNVGGTSMFINRSSTDTNNSAYFRAASSITVWEIGA